MSPKRLKNRLKNWLFVVLGLGGFLAVYFFAFCFFSRQNIKDVFAVKLFLPSAVNKAAEDIPATGFSAATSNISNPAPADPSLTFGSFFDTFSSSAAINSQESNLYQDKDATAIFYPPDYDWQPATSEIITPLQNDFDSFKFNDFAEPYYDRRCLAAGCLEQKGNELFYKDKILSLPSDIKKSDLAAISIGSLSKHWLVGFTLKDEKGYKGEVFYFDGRKFKPLITPSPILSSYFGLFGFGGKEDDFLMIYGAYKGIAYHIKPEKITDVSRFFDIRIMNNGFKPEVVRTAYKDNINWYVFSSTLSRTRFIKLWQNRTSEIVGETVFADFFTSADESAAFKLITAKADEITFLAKIRGNNSNSWRVFTDRGFKNDTPGVLIFNPITHGGASSSIAIKKIAISRLDLDTGSTASVKFLFSPDGNQWQEIRPDQNLDFTTPALKYFFLKINFSAFKDKFYSPFLEAVLFDYYCQK